MSRKSTYNFSCEGSLYKEKTTELKKKRVNKVGEKSAPERRDVKGQFLKMMRMMLLMMTERTKKGKMKENEDLPHEGNNESTNEDTDWIHDSSNDI